MYTAIAIALIITQLAPKVPWLKALEIAQGIVDTVENPEHFWAEINAKVAKLDETIREVTG